MKSFHGQFTTERQEFTTEVAEESGGSGDFGVEEQKRTAGKNEEK